MADTPASTPDPLTKRAREYVAAVAESDYTEVAYALAEARALVDNWVSGHEDAVPDPILDRAIVEVAADLFYRRMARNGVMEFAGTDLAPFRIARDPMKAAYPLLTQFVPGGIA